METPKKFGTSLFGYKKKNVNAYIMESAQRFEKAKKELEEKIEKLETENAALLSAKSDLGEKISSLEKERSYIADALLNASQEAEKIVVSANTEAARIRAEHEKELAEINSVITREKNRISEIRNDAKKALNEYISRLDGIDMENSEETIEKNGEYDAEDDKETEPFDTEKEFSPIISDADSLMEDLEAIDSPAEDADEDEDFETGEEIYDVEENDEGDFEIEDIEL